MKLQEAIEIAGETISPDIPTGHFRHIDAIRLLIEAGKHIQKQRRYGLAFNYELLPGETRE